MISLKNVSAGYNKREIIKNINITFEKETVTCIIGKNGCGKTTLLRTSSNLLKPFCGNVLINENGRWQDIYAMKGSYTAKKISFLPQSKETPNISVYDLVMHGRFPYLNFARIPQAKDRIIVDKALDKMGLNDYKHKNLQELSGGQRQKVYIAMILAQDTEIIFLDEPTTYLDINHQLEILHIVKELKNIGKTIVMVLHDLNLALSYSDRVCLMENGEILLYDRPKAVIESGMINRVFNVVCEEVCLKGDGSKQYVFALG